MVRNYLLYKNTREEYEGAHMEHMIAEKLLEIALKKNMESITAQ